MERNDPRYQAYVEILKEELIPAMGCTEPIALAYAAAKAREVLGVLPDSVQLQVSGSIIKNVKSVIVPNTGHLKGMEAAVAAGIIAGSAEKELEVISEVSEEKKSAIRDYLQTVPITIEHTEQGHVFDIVVTERCGQDYARVRIADYHTNICRIEKNGTVLYEVPLLDETVQEDARADRSLLNMQDIWDFAETADLRDVADLLERQIRYNNAIAEEGLLGDYGANIGRVLLTTYGNDVSNRAKAKAAAGSDARMNGCALPVVINSGSGNQGIACTMPVVAVARKLGVTDEQMMRAVTLSNLMGIYIKSQFGRLSAFCGATVAGVGSACGIAYLLGGGLREVENCVFNMIGDVTGMLCDGAKADCALKIATCTNAAMQAALMAMRGIRVLSTDGIVEDDVEKTISNFAELGNQGSVTLDQIVLDMMLKKEKKATR